MLVLVMSILAAVLSLFSAVVCHRAASGRLPRNHVAGIRIPSLFASEEAWKAGHRAGMRVCLLSAVLSTATIPFLAAVGAYSLSDGLDLLVSLSYVIGWAVIFSVSSARAARRAAQLV